ncbi:MAG: hypothetical protein Q7S87_03510 [Agitococcus sp.]|nr:hypothetical protein [Agitococcus sp.]MDO9177652.1 hypothetical protein [Agitococcus sp.]
MSYKERKQVLATDEILIVNEYAMDGGEALARCPHCKRVLGMELPVLGEQFQDKVCGGWLEVSHNARRKKIEHVTATN